MGVNVAKNLTHTARTIAPRLKGFDRESHTNALASGLARLYKGETDFRDIVRSANALVEAVKEAGVTSFFAASYATVFGDADKALRARSRYAKEFKDEHALTDKRRTS